MELLRRFRVELVCFPLVAGGYLIHLFVFGYDRFYFDALDYWNQGHHFQRNGHFSLVAYNDPFRGYSLPLLYHALQVVASNLGFGSVTSVKLFGTLLAATLGVVVAPRLARLLLPATSIGIRRVLALNALIFLYWRDHFDFPLSDFPSLLAACLGLLALSRRSAPGYLGAGLAFGLAANARPAYLPALIAVIAVAALLPLRPWDWRRRGAVASLVLAGALAASLPQILINHHQSGSWSPFISKGKPIVLIQLSDGLLAQKYETYVGDPSRYRQPQVFYLDPASEHVLAEEHIPPHFLFGQRADIVSYGQYARIVLHHPVEMAASWVRHLFNGLDVQYPTPYIRDLGNRSIVLSLLQYTLVFLAIVRLLLPEARRALGRIRWAGVIVLLSACLTAIPGPVEPRFFLAVQMLVYMLVCFGPATKASLLGGKMQRRLRLAACYAGFLLICLTLSSSTLAERQYPGPTLGFGPTALS